MRRLFRALAIGLGLLVAPLSLASCASLASLSGHQELATADEKALLAAELSFDAALTIVETADNAGLVTQERAQVLLPLIRDARAALLQARALYDANETVEAGVATNNAVIATGALVAALVDLGLLQRS